MRALVLLAFLAIPASARADCAGIDPSATPPAALPSHYLASIAGIPAVDKPDDVIKAETRKDGLDHYVKLAAAAAARSRVAGSKTAKADRDLAIATYAKALLQVDGKKDTPGVDLWRFDYGLVLIANGNAEDGRNALQVILKDYPDSRFVPPAYVALGDQLASLGKADDAERYYNQTLKFPKSPVYDYAMYQEGYVHLVKQRYQDALETFFKVVQLTKNGGDAAMNAAARTGFVIAYQPIGKVDKAEPAFQRVDPKHTDDMLEELAIAYERASQPDKAKLVYESLVRHAPDSARLCAWKMRLAELAKRSP